MRWLLILVAVGAAGAAGYLGTVPKNSFSAYSSEQLDVLERELGQQLQSGNAPSRSPKASSRQAEQQQELAISRQFIQEERQRRLYFFLALGVAGVAAVAAFFVRGSASSAPSLRGSSAEDARLVAVVGDPAIIREGARQKAAALLGVSVDAPPAVIEAALQAQLRQRDPESMKGLTLDLQRLVHEQREQLVRARDLLLNKSPSAPAGSPKSQ